MNPLTRLNRALEAINQSKAFRGFKEELGVDRSEMKQVDFKSRQDSDLDADSTRLDSMAANHRGINLARDLTGTSDPVYRSNRDDAGLGLKDDPKERLGQLAAVPLRDIATDETRSWWWLINAAQAIANVTTEKAFGMAAPHLYKSRSLGLNIADAQGQKTALDRELVRRGKDGKLKLAPGVIKDQEGNLSEKVVRGGHASLLLFPTGAAVNTGLGLMTPFGGAPGYEAAVPSQEDPSKTENVLAEVGAKYFLGRTGNLLPYEEFQKVRPDVSRGEYNAYKAFKYNKDTDLDLSDGDFTLPAGVLKGTTDGIHGPELQFLGRSLPMSTVALPVMTGIAGGVIPARMMNRDLNSPRLGMRTMRNMGLGSAAGTAVGMVAGNLLEAERQRRNMRENERKTTALDPESTTVGF